MGPRPLEDGIISVSPRRIRKPVLNSELVVVASDRLDIARREQVREVLLLAWIPRGRECTLSPCENLGAPGKVMVPVLEAEDLPGSVPVSREANFLEELGLLCSALICEL